ncbi:MAG: serine hydrolase [Luteitalea sp.]|nr:serine hydrolase [Luteitalea sp.]
MSRHILDTRSRALSFTLTFAVTLMAAAARAQSLPTTTPESVGVSQERLGRLSDTMKRYVDERRIGGVVTLIARDGKVIHFDAFGYRDVEAKAPMEKDTIFRIASMSKAITSVAIMMLMEEGKILLNDPVSTFVPAFENTVVAVPPHPDAEEDSPVAVVPAKRSITIRDLLTQTAGISYGAGATRAQYQAAGFDEWYFADSPDPIGRRIEKLATLPFDAQPGERYVYGYATDILGYVVEKVSGLPLDQFLRTRIFEPLKMADTYFFLPPEERERLSVVYAATPDGPIERAPDEGRSQGAYVDGPRACFSGGAGLLSTAQDYARFLQMLLNGGKLDDVRILGPKTVELMTSNHVGSLFADGQRGFGLGFEVVEHLGRAGRPGTVGEFGWGGAYFTRFWVDPREKLVAVFMAQLLPSEELDLQDKFRALVYQAIETPGPVVAEGATR